ncbi:MAG: U32 family peptidase [Ruminococcaceae bacterium]|nr:U32 family peptidase [Oscillospiraceae bacterium]
MKRIELLAPAGDMEKLNRALQYGADAVYLAGNLFGMRAAAKNFDAEELRSAVARAHAQNVAVYITVNTMPHHEEVQMLPEFLEYCESIGVDAFIAADLGVFRLIQRHAPKTQIHISTQASVVNYESARAWHDLGANRIVLARELSLDEICTIRQKTDPTLQLEAFVHGAMCMSYSGRCMLSKYMIGRDANRGACAQPCRWKYKVQEEKRPDQTFTAVEEDGTYIFNSKDLCMIDHIPDLVRAGLDSLKIEGRVKSSYYVACVTNAYRMALDAYHANPDTWKPNPNWREEVEKVSHRVYYTGFYYNEPIGEKYDTSDYVRDWDVVGVVESCEDDGMAWVQERNRFYAGDSLEILVPGTIGQPFVATELWDEEGNTLEVAAKAEMRLRMKLPCVAPNGAMIRKKR